jgi:hypothetical protein
VGSQIEVALERTTITNQVTNSLGEGGPFLQTQSQVEVMAGNVIIGSQVINSAGDGSSLLAVASLLQTNASNLIIGYATFNSLEESTLQTVNLVEINSNNVLIGQRVTNSLNGNVTLDAFSGWEFSTDGNLTLPAGGDILNSNGQSVLTSVTVGNVASGAEGALWYNTEDGRTYVYALDTWIDASPAVVPGNMVGYGQDGNITLNEDASINYANGVSILSGIDSSYGDSQVAEFLGAFTGNIAKIGASPLSIAAASVRLTSDNETWTFAPDGVIALPNGMTIESYGTLGVNAVLALAVTILVSQLTTTEHLRGLALQPMQQAAWHPAHGCLAQMVTYHFQMAALKPLPTQVVAVAQAMPWSTVATQLHLKPMVWSP